MKPDCDWEFLRNAEWLVGVRIVNQRPGWKTADVDDEFGIVGTLDEPGFSGDGFSIGERFRRGSRVEC